jgi:hypothetical protein
VGVVSVVDVVPVVVVSSVEVVPVVVVSSVGRNDHNGNHTHGRNCVWNNIYGRNYNGRNDLHGKNYNDRDDNNHRCDNIIESGTKHHEPKPNLQDI